MTAIRSVRAAEGKFVQISNAALQDRRLSAAARGILAFVLSLPVDHHLTAGWLEDQFPEGRRRIRSALAELEACGYYRRTRISHGRGKWEWDQVISDAPMVSSDQNRTHETTSGNTASPQVSSRDRFSPDEDSTDEKRSHKYLNTDPTKDEDLKDDKSGLRPASRQGRAEHARPERTAEQIIQGIRAAVTDVYGDDANADTSDASLLALWERKRPQDGTHVRSITAYMAKIFADTANPDTLLAGLDTDDPDATGASPSLPWACPRCGGCNAEPTDAGVCTLCEAALVSFYQNTQPRTAADVAGWSTAILTAVKDALMSATGQEVPDTWAARVADQILTGRNVIDPAAYVTTVITTDPNPRRFLPTHTPSQYHAA